MTRHGEKFRARKYKIAKLMKISLMMSEYDGRKSQMEKFSYIRALV